MKSVQFCRWGLVLLFVIAGMFAFSPAYAQQGAGDSKKVVASGIGGSKEMALRSAMRSAVEQGVGVLIESSTTMENYQILNDSIYSKSEGYVRSYEELSYNKDSSGLHNVTIAAVVSTRDIENDLVAIGLLKYQMGDKRFMTVFRPENRRQELLAKTSIAKSAEGAINNCFAEKGFSVVDRDASERMMSMLGSESLLNAEVDQLAKFALQFNADLLLIYTVDYTDLSSSSSAHDQRNVTVSVKAVDPTTARFLTQKGASKVINYESGQNDVYAANMTAQGANIVGKAIAQQVFKEIINHYKDISTDGENFAMWFRNFTERENMKIYKTLRDINGMRDVRVRQEARNLLQVDVQFVGPKMELKLQLFDTLAMQGIELSTQQAQGNRFLFFKAGTENPYSN